jgi:hypothetical protein
MNYSKATHNLIERMCKNVERKDFVLDKKNAEECILKTYDLFGLKRPAKIEWFNDLSGKKWNDIAWSARSAGSAWSAWSALDYDFDWFVIEHEYCKNRKQNPGDKPNENDRLYLEYSELLMQAKEYGLGYRIEWEDTLYFVPTPLVLLDERNRYHSIDKPALRWKNGEEFYYLQRVIFNKGLWEKVAHDKLTAQEVFAIENTEQRRIAYELMDKSKMRQFDNFKVLEESKDDCGNTQKIISFNIKGFDKPFVYFNCICPTTGREYFLQTEKETCLEAKRASFGITNNIKWDFEY